VAFKIIINACFKLVGIILFKFCLMATDQKYQFVYNGVEYDATDYVKNHPGGIEFIQNMKN
jgi:hypothetical protein